MEDQRASSSEAVGGRWPRIDSACWWMEQIFPWRKSKFCRYPSSGTPGSSGEQTFGTGPRHTVGLPWSIVGGLASGAARAGRRHTHSDIFQGRRHRAEDSAPEVRRDKPVAPTPKGYN